MAKRAAKEKRQIGVMIHRKHPKLVEMGIEFPEGENFALMEWWVIKGYWVDWQTDDKGGDLRVLMAHFEKVTEEGVWWSAAKGTERVHEVIGSPQSDSEVDVETATPEEDISSTCTACEMRMVARYEGDPVCGRPECDSSKDPRNYQHLPKKRTYRKTYLTQRALMDNLHVLDHHYLPPAPTQPAKDELIAMIKDERCSRPGWNSYLCLDCGRFNKRIFWNKMECRCCGSVIDVKLPELSFDDVVDKRFLGLHDGVSIPDVHVANGAQQLDQHNTQRHIVSSFGLSGSNKVHIAFPKRDVIDEAGGPRDLWNHLWKAVQDGDLVLERIPTTTSLSTTVVGQLTSWFGANIGEPYKARMKFRTNHTFDEVPQVLKDIRTKIVEVVEEVLGERPAFNELLVIGNYPKMEMGWHDDGEEDVEGEIIASMSLGGSAQMSFGLNHVYLVGRKFGSSNLDVDLDILPGCLEEQRKRRLRESFESGAITRDQYEKDMRNLVLSLKAGQLPTSLLDFPLAGTGAVMIQECKSSLHKFYKHKVESTGLARLVVTGRFLRSQEERKAEEEAVLQSKKRLRWSKDAGKGDEGPLKKRRQSVKD